MMTRTHVRLFLVVFVLLIAVASIGAVYSTWDYKEGIVNDYRLEMTSSLFLWKELPKGDEGTIIETTGGKVADSLNNPNSELSTAIDSKNYFGLTSVSSVDNLHGDIIRQEMGLDPKATFLLDFSDPNTRVLYSTTVEIGGASSFGAVDYVIPQGEWIYPVYRTVCVYDNNKGVWVQQSTARGYAKSDEYVTFLSAAPLFDPASWTRGKIGDTFDNAIYAYQGQNVVASLDTADEKAYYKIVVPKNKTQVVVDIASPANATATMYNASRKKLSVKSNGKKRVQFNSSGRNATYYIEVVGGESISFTIS